ncbi:MAG TPA: SpoIIE family protein phosphatase [Candidatus Sulfotelmatobacter sp.]|nr:SpoIIE family protein phosphatase [Candidatus Sulfotelmatobacter sp.]
MDEAVTAIDERAIAASMRLLAAASRELAASLDATETIASVGRLVVPEFADGFSVELDEGEIRTSIGRRGVLTEDTRSVPLVAHGRALGYLRVAPRRGVADPSLWDQLALRIAVSVDAEQVYAREHHVADTLQRALLPERLPVDERFVFDAAYRPGAEEAIVGGDWYDAFRLPDGRIAFSIGDVAGHGLRAAIVMGEVRQAFRAAALNPNSPSLVLERANTIVNMRPNPVMVTALFGIIDPTDGTLTYAAAGHPAPILALPAGSVQTLPKDGLPLGIVDRVEASDWTFTIPPGALLALYTDGLVEYSRDVVEGERRVLDGVRASVIEGDAEPAAALQRRVFAGSANTDDVATLTVSAADRENGSFTFAFTAVPMAVPIVRRSLARYLERLGVDGERTFSILSATGEALANAVEHAYVSGAPGLVHVRAELQGQTLVVMVEDEGSWKPAQRREERGRGLPLMRALVNAVEIRTHHGRTEVRLSMRLAGGQLHA